MGFSRQEYWSGLPFPPPGDLPDPGIDILMCYLTNVKSNATLNVNTDNTNIYYNTGSFYSYYGLPSRRCSHRLAPPGWGLHTCDLSTPLTDEETEAQTGPLACPRLPSQLHPQPQYPRLHPPVPQLVCPGLPHPSPTHADEARGKPRERDVGLGGLGVSAAVADPADVREAVAVGAKGHGRDQGHGAHGQREAPVEAPHLAAGAEAPGPESGRRPSQRWGRRAGCPWGPWTKELALTSPPRCGTSARRPQLPQLYNGACNTPEARPSWGLLRP